MMELKKCSKCLEEKPFSSFSKGRGRPCKACVRKYYDKNKEEISNWHKEYRKNNKEAVFLRKQKHRQKNKDKIALKKKTHYEQNREIRKKVMQAYAKANRSKFNYWNAKRKAQKLQATPPWLTKLDLDHIAMFYEAAADQKQYGLDCHVDHIIPLQGKEVCGLHVPWNLQVLPASENISKGNRL